MTALDDALWPRAALPRRPMLGAVLDALIDWHRGEERPSQWLAMPGCTIAVGVVGAPAGPVDGVHFVVPPVRSRDVSASIGRDVRRGWITTDPAEAYELLQARGLVPMDCRSRFVCDRCYGSGRVVIDYDDGDTMACHLCDNGHRPHPPTVAALASWASLGFAAGDDGAPGILGAEELARQPAPEGAVMWRVAALDPGAAPRQGAAGEIQRAGLGIVRPRGVTVLYVPPLGLVTP